jgi:hypothetical protein
VTRAVGVTRPGVRSHRCHTPAPRSGRSPDIDVGAPVQARRVDRGAAPGELAVRGSVEQIHGINAEAGVTGHVDGPVDRQALVMTGRSSAPARPNADKRHGHQDTAQPRPPCSGYVTTTGSVARTAASCAQHRGPLSNRPDANAPRCGSSCHVAPGRCRPSSAGQPDVRASYTARTGMSRRRGGARGTSRPSGPSTPSSSSL